MKKKIKLNKDEVVAEIAKFYDFKVWHFLTLNGLELDENLIEIQWIFAKYEALEEVYIFYCEVSYQDIIPSIVELIPSAIISQREIVDMFGIKVEGSTKGLYLDEDSMQAPLSGCRL